MLMYLGTVSRKTVAEYFAFVCVVRNWLYEDLIIVGRREPSGNRWSSQKATKKVAAIAGAKAMLALSNEKLDSFQASKECSLIIDKVLVSCT